MVAPAAWTGRGGGAPCRVSLVGETSRGLAGGGTARGAGGGIEGRRHKGRPAMEIGTGHNRAGHNRAGGTGAGPALAGGGRASRGAGSFMHKAVVGGRGGLGGRRARHVAGRGAGRLARAGQPLAFLAREGGVGAAGQDYGWARLCGRLGPAWHGTRGPVRPASGAGLPARPRKEGCEGGVVGGLPGGHEWGHGAGCEAGTEGRLLPRVGAAPAVRVASGRALVNVAAKRRAGGQDWLDGRVGRDCWS